jgi:hypothetical protein
MKYSLTTSLAMVLVVLHLNGKAQNVANSSIEARNDIMSTLVYLMQILIMNEPLDNARNRIVISDLVLAMLGYLTMVKVNILTPHLFILWVRETRTWKLMLE